MSYCTLFIPGGAGFIGHETVTEAMKSSIDTHSHRWIRYLVGNDAKIEEE
jgi:hypothetical protein